MEWQIIKCNNSFKVTSWDCVKNNLLLKVKEILPMGCRESPPAVIFHGINGTDLQSQDSPSWFNLDEINQLLYYVNELFRLRVSSKDIGIITPYKNR